MTIDYPPIRDLRDIEAIERLPLEQQIFSWDVNDWVRAGLDLDPAKVAIDYFETADPASAPQQVSYADLKRQVVQAANLFHALGVGKDDAVIALMPSLPALYVTLLGGLAAGIVCCLNWMLKPPQILELIRAAGAKAVVVQGPAPGYEIWENFRAIADELGPEVTIFTVPGPGGARENATDFARALSTQPGDRVAFARRAAPSDIAAYIHSGGTTDSPKLVKITHRGLAYKIWVSNLVMAHQAEDVIFADYPIFHVAGFYNRCICAIADGMRVVIPTALGARNKEFIARYWKFVERCGVTVLAGVPTTLSVLAKNPPQGENISSLRPYMPTGSTGMPIEVAREIERIAGVRCLLTYGATEYTANVTQAPRDGDPRYGSAGIRIPFTQLRIATLDARGAIERDCAEGEIGTVLVKGPGVTPGYVDERFNRGLFTADGWFVSGDLGRFDPDGYLWLTGRVKDVIIRGGHNIDAALIEDVLRRHPAVLLCAAVGKPDSYAGELPVAYVQTVRGARATAEELKAHVGAEITERAATPDEIFLVDPLPLTDIGKPDKALLRRDAAARTFSALLDRAVGTAAGVTVEIRPDPTHGTLAVIQVESKPADRAAIETKIREAMLAYTIAHRIDWRHV
ncbi:MAG TPA: acyl-CoA synthetase [Stellaceae bacterium]|jgi:fatty-acyl-CoA synthase|nr:acyl-CoA synthetase [Stellaceae bacterium]